jgi:hypothetical protein
MAKFRLWTTWHSGEWIEVEAPSFEEAVKKAYADMDLSTPNYISDTFQVDEYASRRDGEQPSHWEEDSEFPAMDWKYEVANDDTRQGYREWVNHKHQQKAENA